MKNNFNVSKIGIVQYELRIFYVKTTYFKKLMKVSF